MEVNVWTSSSAEHIQRDKTTGLYKVIVRHKEGQRIFTVKHVILATGFASGGAVYVPAYPGLVGSTKFTQDRIDQIEKSF